VIGSLKFFVLSIALQFVLVTSFAQICTQPGSLLSVRNSYRSHLEYIVFTFVDPYQSKGDLHKTNKALFNLQPSINSSDIKGEQFYSITFSNAYSICDTKNYYVVPQQKIKDIKLIQRKEGKITYVIGLAKDAKITSHTAYDYHGFHMVKIRVE
jgi:hypothetical protein